MSRCPRSTTTCPVAKSSSASSAPRCSSGSTVPDLPRMGRLAARLRARAARARALQDPGLVNTTPITAHGLVDVPLVEGALAAPRRRGLPAQGGAARVRRHRRHHDRLRAPRLLPQPRSGKRQHPAVAVPRRAARLHPRRGTAHVGARRPLRRGTRQRRHRAATRGSSATCTCSSPGSVRRSRVAITAARLVDADRVYVGSRGSPSTRSPNTLRWISFDPP